MVRWMVNQLFIFLNGQLWFLLTIKKHPFDLYKKSLAAITSDFVEELILYTNLKELRLETIDVNLF